ncbi:MarR family winged helix-turn-helix transcriptional regulator [Listeria sp. PSOL-1]|uniref:MarR family winged helix-turn-helix transcriptional regulator n=1 Tax=Listeria sp. PSOL-1 TaxID=1844999 RepID=UPI0018D8048D|nr:MarR family transcriptional regulator [Listeria sp. PSOL-1]
MMSHFTDELMKQLHFISEASNAYMSQKKQKLTGQQRVLAVLGLEDGLTQSYLAEVLDLRPSSLAELLKKMEEKGDIHRKEDAGDKRIKRVYLTEAGRLNAKENAALKKEDYSENFFSGLNQNEKKQFSEYLQKVADGWNEDLKQQAQRFVDPMDRMQAMQEMRESLMERFGHNWQELTPDEVKNLRKEIRKMMKESSFANNRRGHSFPPNFPRGFGRRENPNFWREMGFFPQKPFEKQDEE